MVNFPELRNPRRFLELKNKTLSFLLIFSPSISKNFFFIPVAFKAIQIIVALSMAVVAIGSSALSCQAICCRNWITRGSVSYSIVGTDGQPVAFQGLQPSAIPLRAGGAVVPVLGSLPNANSICKFFHLERVVFQDI